MTKYQVNIFANYVYFIVIYVLYSKDIALKVGVIFLCLPGTHVTSESNEWFTLVIIDSNVLF